MSNERPNEQARVVVWDFNERADAESNVGPGLGGAFSYYLNPRRWGKTAGRATLREFWGFVTGAYLGGILVFFLTPALVIAATGARADADFISFCVNCATTLWRVIIFAPLFTVLVRRLHDWGISGKKAFAPFLAAFFGRLLWGIDNGGEGWLNPETFETLELIARGGMVAMIIGIFSGARYWRLACRYRGAPWKNRFGAPRLDPPRKRSKK